MIFGPRDIWEALRPFDELNVSYYIGGSLASSASGRARSTEDADIVADLEADDARWLAQRLGPDFHAEPDMIAAALARGDSFNLFHKPSMLKIDVFSMRRPFARQGARRAVYRRLVPDDPATETRFASPEDIILNKLEWYRMGGEVSERQWIDLIGVLRLQEGRLDDAYLDEWAKTLRVADLLDRARREAAT